MKRLALIAAAMILSGCAHTRYVSTYCVGKDQKLPAEPGRVDLTGNAKRDFQIVAGSAARLRVWGQSLTNVLEGCREK